MTLSALELKAVRKLFAHFDKDNNNCLSTDEFPTFIKAALAAPLERYMGDEPVPEELEMLDIPQPEIDWLLRGVDLDNSQTVSFDEIVACFAAIRHKDILALSCMAFRGLDVHHARRINFDDLPEFVGIYGAKVPREEFLRKCDEVLGRRTGFLRFNEWHKVIAGQTLPAKFDPYQGLLDSGSCILIWAV